MHNKLIVILGPTATGKSALAVKLAKKFTRLNNFRQSRKLKSKKILFNWVNGGEIISADSRQVYIGLDIGSGKITKKEMAGIPHHLLDVANPKRKFTVAQFQKLASKKIQEIQKRNFIPFLVGGTGFYIQSIVDGIIIPEVKPNWKLRKQLEKKSVKELFLMLKKLDPQRASSIDPHNPRRLIRAIEIIKTTGKPVQTLRLRSGSSKNNDFLMIGIKKSPTELKKAIAKRLQKRLKGMISEVKNLHKQGLPFKRLEELGLEYRFTAQYLQEKIDYKEMVTKLQKEIEHFAKRQMTWFSAHGGSASGGKHNKKIHWIKGQKEAEKLIRKFVNKKGLELTH